MSINSFDRYFLSWIPDETKLSRPLYLALANQLEQDICSGKLAPGTRLPPQRELADYLGVNFTTITRAYDLCKERNLIYGITGRGSFVAPLPGRGVGEKNDGKSGKPLLELGVVNGFDFIRRPIIEATRQVLEKGYLEELYSYAEPAGHVHQRAAGVCWMEQRGVRCDIEHTAIFAGAQNVISATLLTLFHVGDCIATDFYTYANLIGMARLAHIQLLPIAGDENGMLPEMLDQQCKERKIAGIFLMPDCADPTAITIPEARRKALAEVIRKYRLIVIEDDHEIVLHNGEKRCTFYSLLPEQTVYICGSTKGFCSGLRVTYAAFPEKFRMALLGGLHHLSIKTSPLDAEIITELIVSGRANWICREKQKLAQRCNRIFDTVFPKRKNSGKNTENQYSFFRCLPLPESRMDGVQIEELLARKGVSVFHSHRFTVRQQSGSGFLRLSISSIGSDMELRQALEIVRDTFPEIDCGNWNL